MYIIYVYILIIYLFTCAVCTFTYYIPTLRKWFELVWSLKEFEEQVHKGFPLGHVGVANQSPDVGWMEGSKPSAKNGFEVVTCT